MGLGINDEGQPVVTGSSCGSAEADWLSGLSRPSAVPTWTPEQAAGAVLALDAAPTAPLFYMGEIGELALDVVDTRSQRFWLAHGLAWSWRLNFFGGSGDLGRNGLETLVDQCLVGLEPGYAEAILHSAAVSRWPEKAYPVEEFELRVREHPFLRQVLAARGWDAALDRWGAVEKAYAKLGWRGFYLTHNQLRFRVDVGRHIDAETTGRPLAGVETLTFDDDC